MAPNRGRPLVLLAVAAVLPTDSTLIGAEVLDAIAGDGQLSEATARELKVLRMLERPGDYGKAELQPWAQSSSTETTTASAGSSAETTTASSLRGGRAKHELNRTVPKVMDFRNDTSSGQLEHPGKQASSTETTTAPAGSSAKTTTASSSRGGRAKVIMDFRNVTSSGQLEHPQVTSITFRNSSAGGLQQSAAGSEPVAGKGEANGAANATTEAAQQPFNCSAGALRWQWGWSDEKKAHCCRLEKIGCVATLPVPATASGATAGGSEEVGHAATSPSSETIRQMVCMAAGSRELQDKMVNIVCDEIEAAMPWTKDEFEPDCVTALEAAWDDTLAVCPQDTEAPSDEDLTRIMCNLALGDGFTGQAVREMCKVMERELPWMKLEPNCHAVLEGMADRAAEGCNGTRASETTGTWSSTTSVSATVSTTTATTETGTSTSATSTISTTLTFTPMAHADIERLVCTTATRSQISGRHYGDVCSRIHRENPHAARTLPGDCLEVLNADWDALVENCPHGSETVARSSYEREHLICTFSTRDQIEGRRAAQVCRAIGDQLPWVGFGGACRDRLAEVWDAAAEKCPHGHDVTPSAEDVQKLACTFGTQRQIKVGNIGDMCARIGRKLPWLKFATNCPREMKAVWPYVEQKCPLGVETVPAPEDYTKLVCGLATPQQIRVGDSSGVCNVIHSELPWLQFQPDCETVLDDGTVWYDARTRCPKGRQTVPSPYEIVKLVCTVSSAAQVASKSIPDVCGAMRAQVPWVVEVFDPDCPTVLEAAWDEVLAKCPQGQETVPSLEEFERLACGMATRAEMEARDSTTLCGKMAYHVPWMVMQPTCKSWFDSSWEQLGNACPYGHDVLLSSESLVKVICSVASKRQIQNTDGQATCAQIESKTPWLTFMPDCPTALAGVWEEAAAQCPEGSAGVKGMPVNV